MCSAKHAQFDTQSGSKGRVHALPLHPMGKSHLYPLDMRLGEPQVPYTCGSQENCLGDRGGFNVSRPSRSPYFMRDPSYTKY